MNNMKFDFDDILLMPAVQSSIRSRKGIRVFDRADILPLFTAPMDTVVETDHRMVFTGNRIYRIIPRTQTRHFTASDCRDMRDWFALSLDQFERFFLIEDTIHEDEPLKACIDIANGHMQRLTVAIRHARKKYGDRLRIMAGNVAHPGTYLELSDAGADYIRVGIGNGSGCSTSVHTGIGYPLASLIHDIRNEKCRSGSTHAKVVADGGIRKYADIIKALALGADYVMCGGIFNKALESAGHTFAANKKFEGYTVPGDRVDQYSDEVRTAFKMGSLFYKKFRGMSTKEVQAHLGNEIRSSEGVTRMILVEYTIAGWVDNFMDYLASAMSYTNHQSLEEFIGQPSWNLISQNSFNRFNK